jgi:hypothetical protein
MASQFWLRSSLVASVDSGKTWSDITTGLTDSVVYSLAVSGRYLFAGTSRSGIWKRSLSQLITQVAREGYAPASSLALAQNYPNPFNPSTSIEFELPMAARVRLTILNLLGQQVARLIDAPLAAGRHTIEWRAHSPSGVYLYRLEATSIAWPTNRFTQTRKMILLR